MNTITKLRINVNNENLPVIVDGKLLNAFVARYINKLREYNYTLTQDELSAVNNLVDDAVSHKWLQYIDYFFPFIGSRTNLQAAMIPLIDRHTDYDIYEDTPLSEGFFLFNDNSIRCYGVPGRSGFSGQRGIIIPQAYTDTKAVFFSIDASADFSVMPSSTNLSTFIGFCNTDFSTNNNNSRTLRKFEVVEVDGINGRALERTSATGLNSQSIGAVVPKVPLNSLDSDYVLYVQASKRNSESIYTYSQFCQLKNGDVRRNIYKTDSYISGYVYNPGYPFIGAINQATDYNTIVCPHVSIYCAGVLNDVLSSDMNYVIGQDLLKFNMSLGKITQDVPAE